MSSKAMTWAWQQISVVKGSTHHLLLAICENVPHETGLAFPSIAGLIEMTGQDRKTVIAGIERILAAKLMKDTGAKTGRTNQIPVYQLAPWVKDWGPAETVGKTGLFAFADNGADSPAEQSRFSGEESQKRDTDPSIGPKDGILPPSPDGEGTPKGELELFGEGGIAGGDPVPLEDFVVEAWHALKRDFPGVADIDVINDSRKKKIHARADEVVRARKKQKRPCSPEDVWLEIFDRIRASTFLTGRDPPGRGYTRPFKLTIDFVLRPSEFLSILDRDNDTASGNRAFDARTGRQFGPAEQATRAAIARLDAPRQRRASG